MKVEIIGEVVQALLPRRDPGFLLAQVTTIRHPQGDE